MKKRDEIYEAITIHTLYMRYYLYTGGGLDRDAFDSMYLNDLGEYERKLAKKEGIDID